MSSGEQKNRKEQMIDSFLDTGTDSAIEWGNNYIKTTVPKILDWISVKVKEVFSTIADKPNQSIRSSIRKSIIAGIEIGEKNKEQALIEAMKKMGINENQIHLILETSNQFLISKDDIVSIDSM